MNKGNQVRNIKFSYNYYESVMGTLTGVAWNALNTLNFPFYVVAYGSFKGRRNFVIVLY